MTRDEVDRFFALAKTIAAAGPWQPDPENGLRFRRSLALEASGTILAQHMEVIALAHLGEEKARALVLWPDGTVVARLEMGNAATRHANRSPRPPGIPPVVSGPHAHLWQDNRHLLRRAGVGLQLRYARPAPPGVTTLEEALRWFSGSCTIRIETQQMPGLPRRPTLL
jgi:hypothetical protein